MLIYGESKGGGGHGPVEEDDTLSSKQNLKVLYALSNGPIAGIQSIYLNGAELTWIRDDINTEIIPSNIMTPSEVPGKYSIPGVYPDYRVGEATQSSLKGFAQTESLTNINVFPLTTLSYFVHPLDNDIDACKVVITLDKLVYIDEDGNAGLHTVEFEIKTFASSNITGQPISTDIITKKGKSSSTYVFDVLINKPGNYTGPWSIKISRITADDPTDKLIPKDVSYSRSSITSLINIYYKDLSYPNIALIGMTFTKANRFNNNFPETIFRVHGIKIPIPANYNIETGVYSALTPGMPIQFSTEYQPSTNPAWQLLYLYRNTEWGLGLSDDQLDISAFYEFGKFCDDIISTTFNGEIITDKRYTFSNHFTEREEAAKFLMYFYSSTNSRPAVNKFGLHTIIWDRVRTPNKIATNSNVIDGIFDYSSNNIEQRYSSINIMYNDVNNLGKTTTITVTDNNLVSRYGFKSLDIPFVGCYSKAQAVRKARWALYRNSYLPNILSYSVLFDGLTYEIGDIVRVMDDLRCEIISQGVITGFLTYGTPATKIISLDREITIVPGAIFYYYHANGIQSIPFTSSGTMLSIVVATTMPDPVPGTSFIITGAEQEQLWEVTGLSYDSESKTTTVSLIEYSDNLYEYIMTDVNNVTSLPSFYKNIPEASYTCPAVTNLDIAYEEFTIQTSSYSTRGIILSWDWQAPANSIMRASFIVGYREAFTGKDYTLMRDIAVHSATIPDMLEGNYDFTVWAVNTFGRESLATVLSNKFISPKDTNSVTIDIPSIEASGIYYGNTILHNKYELIGITASKECNIQLFTSAEMMDEHNYLYSDNTGNIIDTTPGITVKKDKRYITRSSTYSFDFTFSSDDLTITFDQPVIIKQFTNPFSATSTSVNVIKRSPVAFYKITNIVEDSNTGVALPMPASRITFIVRKLQNV